MAARAEFESQVGALNREKLEAAFFVPALESAGGGVAEHAQEYAAILHGGGYNTIQRCARIIDEKVMKIFAKAGVELDDMDVEDIVQAVAGRPQVSTFIEWVQRTAEAQNTAQAHRMLHSMSCSHSTVRGSSVPVARNSRANSERFRATVSPTPEKGGTEHTEPIQGGDNTEIQGGNTATVQMHTVGEAPLTTSSRQKFSKFRQNTGSSIG